MSSNDRPFAEPTDPSLLAPADRKTAQLCSQVFEVLCIALSECHDPMLEDLVVEQVEPAPSTSRLAVSVSVSVDRPGQNAEEILMALEGARGYLRSQVAAEIHRKRTPELTFRLIPPRRAEV